MSWNKNTRPMSEITARISPLRERAVPYALVRGNGLNDMYGGPGVYVLSYVQCNGQAHYDQMVRSGDCDFDDCIRTHTTTGEYVVTEFTADAQDYGIGKERLKMTRLKPLESVFVVKNTAAPQRLAKYLHLTRDAAAAEAQRLQRKVRGGKFQVLELTPQELAQKVVNCVFQGV